MGKIMMIAGAVLAVAVIVLAVHDRKHPLQYQPPNLSDVPGTEQTEVLRNTYPTDRMQQQPDTSSIHVNATEFLGKPQSATGPGTEILPETASDQPSAEETEILPEQTATEILPEQTATEILPPDQAANQTAATELLDKENEQKQ